MNYFVTGATGFIGKRLVAKLLARPDAVVYFLTRAIEEPRLQDLYAYWDCDEKRVIPIVGDLTEDELGIAKPDSRKLKGKIDHFFHLAALYDLKASAEDQQRVNVDGTRNTVRLAEQIGSKHFHLVSSIAAAGLFEGLFREDMFDEAENLDNPYFRTKHDSEAIVRRECKVPWRIFRPAIVVGDSQTGEMDKIDGPYYFFKLI
ncbi:MAG TPA: SDR family oxidoreductase, partial [Accumulibacter sp.]|nr:SDR family oxidoreductase [Accumulibacter sp.]